MNTVDRADFRPGGDAIMETEARRRAADVGDDALLDLVQRHTLRYFWDFAHLVSGLARERSNVTPRYRLEAVTTGGSGRWTGSGPWCASCSRPTATMASCLISWTAKPGSPSRSAARMTEATLW